MRYLLSLAAGIFLAGASMAVNASEWELGEGNKAFQHLPQYQSYLKNYDDTQMTEYGGSVNTTISTRCRRATSTPSHT